MKFTSPALRLRISHLALFFLFPVLFSPETSQAEGFRIEFKGVPFTIYKVDLSREALALHARDSKGTSIRNAGDLSDYLARESKVLKFATNAGIFSKTFIPLGLHIEDSKLLVPLNLGSGTGNFYLKPNGIFYLKGATASVIPSDRYDAKLEPDFATQSGPLLLVNGSVNELFDPKSNNKLIRSGVGVDEASTVYFAISDRVVSFFDFALLFREELKCRSALYLDGVISRMYVADLNRKETDGNFAALFSVVDRAATR